MKYILTWLLLLSLFSTSTLAETPALVGADHLKGEISKALGSDYIKNLLSGIAIGISATALIISLFTTRRTAIAGRRPVLVFDYDSEIGWRVRNIGSGPALNVVIAQKKDVKGWFNPVRIPPLSKDAEFSLRWCLHVNDTGLGAVYTDICDLSYTSTCGDDLSATRPGCIFPKWKERDIGRHWNQPLYEPEPKS